jgi:hypothetical protein
LKPKVSALTAVPPDRVVSIQFSTNGADEEKGAGEEEEEEEGLSNLVVPILILRGGLLLHAGSFLTFTKHNFFNDMGLISHCYLLPHC